MSTSASLDTKPFLLCGLNASLTALHDDQYTYVGCKDFRDLESVLCCYHQHCKRVWGRCFEVCWGFSHDPVSERTDVYGHSRTAANCCVACCTLCMGRSPRHWRRTRLFRVRRCIPVVHIWITHACTRIRVGVAALSAHAYYA